MTTFPVTYPQAARTPRRFRWAVRLLDQHWSHGGLLFVLPDGAQIHIGSDGPEPPAIIRVRNFRFMARVAASGDIGFAEGYMAGEWDTPDLARLLEVLAMNFDELSRLIRGAPSVRLIEWVRHALRRNTRRGSRRNIEAHYDLGEAFYKAWLDPSMTYSSALYLDGRETLQAAQENKYRSLARAIGLQPGHTVLEIGCGWGGFAEYAARDVGARVTAVTISRDQFDYARRRLFEAGLADRADVRLLDYRDIRGAYDRVVSIEMFEAVGESYWPTYFSKLRESLKPGGLAGLQIISIRDDLYDAYRSQTDFIQKYVFPGGALPSEARLRVATADAGLSVVEMRRFGADYARTLAEWTSRFEAAWQQVSDLGFDERFRKLWRFYLAYCRAGFSTGRTDVVQCVLAPV
ncbi:cyclopropane-fatty-acyl-phospholipid synthase family protein [Phenylobacterium sp. J367]|uniref:SAM-dependent methyltransferase n=1 Tax=Phenylobacterium sp. J367 TaxID=2898435 RepID=UPI002150E908|nr:cyclopropane-fatty-acyl-phospholipid synthase family protein [Phenylobacterium sp. J367]MCR5878903.1 cyclopropane-fatty-acyl-phospholipid synthase family protein [Phenylobacterium sp. J367]